jgi:outer membrane receptor protein involved in Fe transport
VDEFQRENNQYGHMVWRRDINASSFFAVAAYGRQTRAMFKTDPFNVLSYTGQQAADQDRMAYSGGLRFDYTHMPNDRHLIKAGFQFDRTQTVNKTMLYAFDVDPLTGNPTGSVVTRNADNRVIGYREEFWLQDQWLVTPRWTLNLGVRGDIIQYQYNEGQVSPRLGVTYRANDANVFHAFYGRMFQPPNLEQIPFALLNTVGTTAEPDNLTANKTRAERSHYFEIGSYHALTRNVWLELTGYYKLSRFQQDAGQFGTTPLLNYFAFDRGFQRGVDAALKVQVTDGFYARGNVAWGQCKGYGLASGHFLLDQKEIGDINTPSGVFCDHSQTVTSSAVAAYRIRERTTISAQMLYASGLRTSGDNAKTNSSHFPSYTVYNASITHVVTLPWQRQKLLLGVDIINLLDHAYFYNTGEGSIGLGVSHAGMPRSVFFRAQYLF